MPRLASVSRCAWQPRRSLRRRRCCANGRANPLPISNSSATRSRRFPARTASSPSADLVLPFELPEAGLRGRLLRLDTVSTRALSAHPLPEAGQRVLAEALALSALLGSALKMEGRLSVQIKGDGPLNLLVTDYFAGGGLRGYARVREQPFAEAGKPADFGRLAGAGALAITIEPKRGAQTYQGLVQIGRAHV